MGWEQVERDERGRRVWAGNRWREMREVAGLSWRQVERDERARRVWAGDRWIER